MQCIQQYHIIEKLGESRGSLVFRAQPAGSPHSVILKMLKARFPSEAEIARIKHEYEIIRRIECENIIRTHDMFSHENGFVLVLEDINAISVRRYLNQHPCFDVKFFLDAGIQAANALGELHRKNIIHRDVKPGNILINPDTGMVKLTDFGIASVLIRGSEQIFNSYAVQGTLLYISPEQTGRMNRVVDYRTDLYSLGATFYKMLTGVEPFAEEDPLILIHSHIAKKPAPPIDLNPQIPPILSDMVLKLLSKNAEDRYQNAFGLMADLLECRRMLVSSNKISPFTLGKKDISGKFIMSRKLFGRNTEIDDLISAFDRVCSPAGGRDDEDRNGKFGHVEMVWVSGEPGIGKSALINEIKTPIAQRNGFFISGKYETFRSDSPYSAIVAAFRQLIRRILSENDERIITIRQSLLEALGGNGKVMTTIIPDLELILGRQPELPAVEASEWRNRFLLIFGKFVDALASMAHPIVLFLDDLQWGDPASFFLMKTILTHCRGHLLMIGSYRSNAVGAGHPLYAMIQDIEKAGIRTSRISLKQLDQSHVTDLVMTSLKCDRYRGSMLASLIFQKTSGNPFFIHEFLNTLHEKKLIGIDAHSGWQWDFDKVSQMNITENVADLLAAKISDLPSSVGEILKKGACIGNRFNLETLSHVLDMPFDSLLSGLDAAMEGGFIRLAGNQYQFNHDRVREACYALIPDAEKAAIHYRIGKSRLSEEAAESTERLFFMADQFNLATHLITDAEEKAALAEMNYDCGVKAKIAAAYAPALKYFTSGIRLLDPSCWDKQYDFSVSLYSNAAESAFLAGDYESMETCCRTVINSARSIYDTASVYDTRIHAFTSQGNFNQGIQTALDVLQRLGCRIPKKPGKLRLLPLLLRLKSSFSEKKIKSLLDLPEVKDRHLLTVFQMLSHVVRLSFITSPELFAYTTLKSAQLSLRYGHCKANCSNYVGMAIIFITGLGDLGTGYELGKLALKLVDRYGARSLQARTLTTYNLMVAHWKEDLKSIIPEYAKSYCLGMETGDPEYAGQSLLMRDGLAIISGRNLVELEKQMADTFAALQDMNQFQTRDLYSVIWRLTISLLDKDETKIPALHNFQKQDQIIASWQSEDARTFLGILYVYSLTRNYIMGDMSAALKDFNALKGFENSFSPLVAHRDYRFYASLVLLAQFPTASPKEQRAYRKFIGVSLARFKKWNAFSPCNNAHRLKLLEAERHRVMNRPMAAQEAYDEAVAFSQKYDFPFEEALAYELAGNFYAGMKKQRMAVSYLSDAYSRYFRIGVAAKLKSLSASHPGMFFHQDIREAAISSVEAPTLTPTGTPSQTFDLSTVIKASQAISEEVELGKLLETMMRITLENAGARKGFLLLENNGRFFVEAEGSVERENINVLQSAPLDEHTGLALSIINYVARFKDAIILKDASVEGDFTQDPYVIDKAPKSIMCFPVINQGKLAGIIYLENNLSTNVFTRERLEILNILSSQMSISIKNAKFYQDLEEKVRKRTLELKAANDQLTKLSFLDPLTHLHNRRYLYEFITALSADFIKTRARSRMDSEKRDRYSKDKVFGIYLLDIDHFKSVNDTYGHQTGDAVLIAVSRALQKMIRSDDFLVRWGGEEFLIILRNITQDYFNLFPVKLRQSLEDTPLPIGNDKTIHKTCSIGCVKMPFDPINPDLLTLEQTINLSDFALYKAKENGRNQAATVEISPSAIMDVGFKQYLVNLSKESEFKEDYIRLHFSLD